MTGKGEGRKMRKYEKNISSAFGLKTIAAAATDCHQQPNSVWPNRHQQQQQQRRLFSTNCLLRSKDKLHTKTIYLPSCLLQNRANWFRRFWVQNIMNLISGTQFLSFFFLKHTLVGK